MSAFVFLPTAILAAQALLAVLRLPHLPAIVASKPGADRVRTLLPQPDPHFQVIEPKAKSRLPTLFSLILAHSGPVCANLDHTFVFAVATAAALLEDERLQAHKGFDESFLMRRTAHVQV